jgi:protein O-GlcNAc transferase
MNIKKAIKSVLEHYQAGNLQQAENICRKILRNQPNDAELLYFLGIIYAQLEKHDLAIQHIKKSLQFNTDNAEGCLALAIIFQNKGLTDEAIIYYQKAINLNPNYADAYYSLGNVLQDKGQLDEAIHCYKEALQLTPTYIEAYKNLGVVFQKKGQLDEAIHYFKKAIEIKPDFAEAYNNLGIALKDKGQLDEAITCCQKALQFNPTLDDAYNNWGNALQEKGQLDEAIAYYEKALQLNPNHANAYYNLGNAFQDKRQRDEAAIACYKKALEIKPDFAEAGSNLFHQLQQMCMWREVKAITAKLDSLTRKALDAGTIPAETPPINIVRYADPSINFAIARSWSHDITRTMSNLRIHFSFGVRRAGKTKIVIGYLSNDFRNHATAHLMLSLFGLHNRDEFEIFCYSYGKDDGSYYRAKIQHDCDKFVDISNLSYDAAAKLIYEDQVDILVDLKGYTGDNRLEICALRPAPIQVTYLGFPGTTGADFIDYVITDKIVTPQEHVPYYSEKFVYLPHCYQVNDHNQLIANKDWKRKDFGLPESCFVFCSFNSPYKIDSVMFSVWMRILQKVPDSVLWLLFGNKIAKENLTREAEARGIKSERLIFAEILPKDEHLARLRLADLALDTRIVNGHTTTSDALWAGVPVIALQGSHFASRVSSSILSAMGLPDLITHSLEEYEALAVGLACNPVELQGIRQRIEKNHLVAPLFDTPRFARNLERAYKEMWKIFLAGEAPRQIEVLDS